MIFARFLVAVSIFLRLCGTSEDTGNDFELHDNHKNVTLNLVAKEANRWYQAFNRTLTRAKTVSELRNQDQKRLYHLWYTGLIYNWWTHFPWDPPPYHQLHSDFVTTYKLIANNKEIFQRMKSLPPHFLNPFRRLYHRGSLALKRTLHPLAIACNWNLSQYKRLQDQDAIMEIQEELIRLRRELSERKLCGIKDVPVIFIMSKHQFENITLSVPQPTWLEIELHLTTLGLMLDVEQLVGKYILTLQPCCIYCLGKMVCIASVNLQQTYKLIHMITNKAPELRDDFWKQRAHLLQSAPDGSPSRSMEQDPSEQFVVRLSRKSVDTFMFPEAMRLLKSCVKYLKFGAEDMWAAQNKGTSLATRGPHYFMVQLFLKAIDFAKSVDKGHESGKRVSKKLLVPLIESVAEILFRAEDEYGYTDVRMKLMRNYPSLEPQFVYHVTQDINNALSDILQSAIHQFEYLLQFTDWLVVQKQKLLYCVIMLP